MDKKKRDLAILAGVEGAIVLGGFLVSRVSARLVAAAGMARVSGMVRDQQTQLPIPFANVTVEEVPLKVDEEGYFLIDKVPLGKYTVKASAPGYRPDTFEWSLEEPTEYVKEVTLVPVETLW